MSLWYTLYVNNPQIDNHFFLNVFRARFRLPYESFLELVEKMKQGSMVVLGLLMRRILCAIAFQLILATWIQAPWSSAYIQPDV
jgi:hypothetical protein